MARPDSRGVVLSIAQVMLLCMYSKTVSIHHFIFKKLSCLFFTFISMLEIGVYVVICGMHYLTHKLHSPIATIAALDGVVTMKIAKWIQSHPLEKVYLGHDREYIEKKRSTKIYKIGSWIMHKITSLFFSPLLPSFLSMFTKLKSQQHSFFQLTWDAC